MVNELDAFFRPRSIAIVGASANPAKLGHFLVKNMRQTGYEGQVFPVSRSAEEILDYPALPSLRDLSSPPDLVLVSIPAGGVPDTIADAVAVEARAAIVLACGFAEAGDSGAALQHRLVGTAADGGLRVIGPNCMGVSDLRARLNATYFDALPDAPGRVGFISQSGAFGGIAFDQLTKLGAGISKFASIGNMADVSHAELIRYYGEDPETEVVAGFIEGIPDGAEFLDAVSDVSAKKPTVILKAGRTKTGSAAAVSHTGSLAGEARVWDDLMREAGAVVAEDSQDLFDAAATLALEASRRPRGSALAIVTISGGPSVVAADATEAYDVELPNLSAGLSDLEPLVPDFASLRNPVDLTAQIAPENYERAVAAVAAHSDVDGILAVNVGLDLPEFGHAFAKVQAEVEKPVVGYVIAPGIEEIFREAEIPNLPSVERAVRAFRRLVDRARPVHERGADALHHFDGSELPPGLVSEHDAKKLLAEHGFLVTSEEEVTSRDEAMVAAQRIGFPVALKVSSADIAHKTEAGGIALRLDAESLVETYERFEERFPGSPFLVQEMVSGPELILGGRRDPLAGPIVMVGLGGVLTELIEDVSFVRAPTSESSALAAVARLDGQRILDGYRGGAAVDRALLADYAGRLGALLVANPFIVEIDLNPVIQTAHGLVVVDALIRAADDGEREQLSTGS